jgi:hypothetical protein
MRSLNQLHMGYTNITRVNYRNDWAATLRARQLQALLSPSQEREVTGGPTKLPGKSTRDRGTPRPKHESLLAFLGKCTNRSRVDLTNETGQRDIKVIVGRTSQN